MLPYTFYALVCFFVHLYAFFLLAYLQISSSIVEHQKVSLRSFRASKCIVHVEYRKARKRLLFVN